MGKRSTLAVAIVAGCILGASLEAETAETRPPAAGVTLNNAYDAFGADRKGLTQDFGFSCVVHYKGKLILFDSGTDARIFERNLKALKIDLRKIDIAIVSHGHYDHIGGFDALLRVNPRVKIYLPNDFFSLGAPIRACRTCVVSRSPGCSVSDAPERCSPRTGGARRIRRVPGRQDRLVQRGFRRSPASGGDLSEETGTSGGRRGRARRSLGETLLEENADGSWKATQTTGWIT